MKFADLHLHTAFSDGTFTPSELISGSLKAGICAVGVVDHDTVSGIASCIEAGAKDGIEVIPGIELSAEFEGAEVHILGYFIDYHNTALLKRLESLKKCRVERIYKIIEKLEAAGVSLNPETVFNISAKGTVGRLHVARALVKEGKVSSVFEAFQKYIGDKGPAYELGFKFSPAEAIKLIRDSGGIPVIAHPYVLKNDGLILEFIKYGLMGIEAYYPEHTQSMTNFYKALAKKHNLLITGGSDCHGSAKPEVKIGSIRIPYELVEELKEARMRI